MSRAGPRARAAAPGELRIEVHPDAEAAARAAAGRFASEARAALRERGRFLAALSGGRTPRAMFRALAREPLPWESVHLFQADEREAPDAAQRNWTSLRTGLLDALAGPPPRLHPMPLAGDDLDAAASRYARELARVAGMPPVLDLVHLGLGDDGHTASLVPGDPALDCEDAPVAATRRYRGFRRLTLTYPALAAARSLLWLVTGADKREAVRRLRAGDPSIPAGRVARARAIAFLDAAASGDG